MDLVTEKQFETRAHVHSFPGYKNHLLLSQQSPKGPPAPGHQAETSYLSTVWMTSCELDLMSRGHQGLWLLWLALQVEGRKEELKDSEPVKAVRL